MGKDPAGVLAARLGYQPQAPAWDLGNTTPVPIERWGKDHWSTFAYVETRWVDHRGMLQHNHMRVHAAAHPIFAAAKEGVVASTRKYSTRLKSERADAEGRWGVVELADHDDYDCLDDAIHAGLIAVQMPVADPKRDVFRDAWGRIVTDADRQPLRPSFLTGYGEWQLMARASFALTDTGQAIASQLRSHKAAGGNFHQFVPTTAGG